MVRANELSSLYWTAISPTCCVLPAERLKANLALASVRAPYAEVGTRLQIEVTAEYERHRVTATVSPTPFFNPERKRSL